MKKLFVLLATAVMAVSAYAGEFADVSVTEVKALVEAKSAVIIDVNGAKSYAAGHVPGALSFAAIKDNLAASLSADKGALIVAYCGNEQCPAYRAGALAAQKLGYTNVKHYAKGIQGWLKTGEPVEKAK